MIIQYIQKAMEKAHYEITDDNGAAKGAEGGGTQRELRRIADCLWFDHWVVCPGLSTDGRE